MASLNLPVELTFETVRRGEFRSNYARVICEPEHAHRRLHQIEAMIDGSILTPRQNAMAKRIFRRLGEAEAKVHGVDLAKVHFHEVGAADSITDIVGAAVGLDLLGVDRFEASPVPPGGGSVRAAHGRMSVPAPATAELLKGIPLAGSNVEMELTTPTGAAILATVAEAFGPLPAMTIEAIGLGAGTRDLPGQANVLRLFVGQAEASGRVVGPGLGARDEPRRPAGRGRRPCHDAPDGGGGPGYVPDADPDEEEPAGRDGDRPLRPGPDPGDGGDPLPRDHDPRHPPVRGRPAQAQPTGRDGRDGVRHGQGEARLA